MKKHRVTNSVAKPLAVALLIALFVGLLAGPVLLAAPAYAAPGLAPTPTLVGAQPAGSKGGAFNCAGWAVTVPAGVVPDGGLVHCGSFNPDKAPQAPNGYRLLRRAININIYDNKSQWITFFKSPLTFCYTYTDADLAAAGGNAANLSVVTAPINGSWSLLLTHVNPATRQACALTDHLTLFDLAIPTSVVAATPAAAAVAAPNTGRPYTYSGSSTTYLVKQGDNLFRIALKYGTTVAAIQAVNGLTSTRIYIGQILLIPSGATTTVKTATPVSAAKPGATATASPGSRTHIVQQGDNLFRIALKYGTTESAIQSANGLTTTAIYVGQKLIIPGK
ncbi:MAG: LysM peptidoglycan-binding domain-containing protein, partial [Chloroflexota bacterium]